jgi:hypothetical protein
VLPGLAPDVPAVAPGPIKSWGVCETAPTDDDIQGGQ